MSEESSRSLQILISFRESLENVSKLASLAADNLVSVGSSLAHVHVPGRVALGEDALDRDVVELGMGIHNEEGFKKMKGDLPALVRQMLAQLLDMSDKDRAYLEIRPSSEIVLLVNNLGGISPLEMGGITEEICSQLEKSYSLRPLRVLSGVFMSSLNGLGFSISILKLDDTGLGAGKSMLELLDAHADATGWTAPISLESWNSTSKSTLSTAEDSVEEINPSNLRGLSSNTTLYHANPSPVNPAQTKKAIERGLQNVIAAEQEVTEYDTLVGDGDCGLCLKSGAEGMCYLKLCELVLTRNSRYRTPQQRWCSRGPSHTCNSNSTSRREEHGWYLRSALRHISQRTRSPFTCPTTLNTRRSHCEDLVKGFER